MRADMHIHSDMSDGPLPPDAIIRQAKTVGVELISITDHDTTTGQDMYKAKALKESIHYIKGIEISAFDAEENVQVHILGYDYGNSALLEDFCSVINMRRKQAGVEMVEKVANGGYPISVEDVLEYTKSGIIYRYHIVQALYERGLGMYQVLYAELFGKNSNMRVAFEYVDACEAICMVKEAGGVAVLAHPAEYNNWKSIPRLIDAGLDGLEIHHPAHTTVNALELSQIAAENKLFATSGSDFHGMFSKKLVQIGYGCGSACGKIIERIQNQKN
jgi:predicted metal-dependent phosphoesterase TrpH